MHVLVLGGTGFIGQAVVLELIRRGHAVSVLCRSAQSAKRAEELAATVVWGKIEAAAQWSHVLKQSQGLIHLATGFGDDAGTVDTALLDALLAELQHVATPSRVIYTGGLWLFGNCTEAPTSASAYAAPAGWEWAAKGAKRVLDSTHVHGMVMHPANVVDDTAAVPPLLLQDARANGMIRLPLPKTATWPLVTRTTLAVHYADVLELGTQGEAYFAVDEAAVPLETLAERTAQALSLSSVHEQISIEVWQQTYGTWTNGYGLSQIAHASTPYKQA